MASVREASFELFRAHGMTTIFGNPGSTELPMLAEFPDDFRYVLGLQEAVVVGMADGYAQASGRADAREPAHGARASATRWARSSTPRRTSRRCWSRPASRCAPQITMQANLTNRDATRVPHPFVKWSYEPPRAAGRAAGARPRHPPARRCRRAGPASSRCRWTTGTRRSTTPRPADATRALGRRRARRADPEAVADARRAARGGARARCWSPAPTSTPAARWDDAVALAERQKLPVFASPAPGRRPPRLPRGPPALPGRAAAGDRAGRRDAQGPAT